MIGTRSDELCHRLDGFPLALELAAARCRTLTPGQLLVRLERRPQLLTDAAGLFEERHRDLDRLIAWSVEELSESARRVLNRLTVVIGSFTLETAEAIAAGDGRDDFDVVDALEELVDAGLIVDEHGDGKRDIGCSNRSASTSPTGSTQPNASRRHDGTVHGSRSLPARSVLAVSGRASVVGRISSNKSWPTSARLIGGRSRTGTSNGRSASSTASPWSAWNVD